MTETRMQRMNRIVHDAIVGTIRPEDADWLDEEERDRERGKDPIGHILKKLGDEGPFRTRIRFVREVFPDPKKWEEKVKILARDYHGDRPEMALDIEVTRFDAWEHPDAVEIALRDWVEHLAYAVMGIKR